MFVRRALTYLALAGIGLSLLANANSDDKVRSMNADLSLTEAQISKLTQEATTGSNEAAIRLAFFYDFVKKDHSSAYLWFKKAADNGDKTTQYNLGVRSLGKGTKEACVEAEYWFSRARENGMSKAQKALDRMPDCSTRR